MKEHWTFLKENDTSFGMFYPLHYTLAAFDSLEHADMARVYFIAHGFAEDDVAAVSGAFVTDRLESTIGAHWFDRLYAGIAQAVSGEVAFLEDDISVARRGGAFLFVYTPSHEEAEHARAMIRQLHPLFARRYRRIGIENIRYPPHPRVDTPDHAATAAHVNAPGSE
ncbi:MAG TPA: hypothetical protein VF269_01095 [Rhodanobacteraceae bacterium]